MTKLEADTILARAAEVDAARYRAYVTAAKLKQHWRLHGFYGPNVRSKGRFRGRGVGKAQEP